MSPPTDDAPAPSIRTAQIITLYLAAGVLVLLTIVAFVARAGKPFSPDPWDVRPIITLMALVGAALALAGHWILRERVVANQLRALARRTGPASPPENEPRAQPRDETQALLSIYVAGMILGAAILEGAVFFAGIAFLIDGKAPALVAALLLVATLLLGFPTGPRVEEWMERRHLFLDEERQRGG